MINIEPYKEDCFDFHNHVVNQKNNRRNDPDYKSRLNSLDSKILSLFHKYYRLINTNNIESISSCALSFQEKQDLLSLYKYGNKPFQELLIKLTTIEGRKFNICQMCTVEPVGSFDHIIPKESFPEYVVNPINLFPSCTTCNTKKSNRWLESEERIFLNLYYDLLPDVEFLKVEFSSYPIPEFSIDESMLSPDFYRLAQSHYEKLNLFRRFRENSSEVIDSVFSSAKSIVPVIGVDEFKKTIVDSSEDMRSIYGMNHWKEILKLALVNHKEFTSFYCRNYIR